MCQCNAYCPCCGQKKQQYYGQYQYGWPSSWPNYSGGGIAGTGGYNPIHTTTDGLGQKYDQFGQIYAVEPKAG